MARLNTTTRVVAGDRGKTRLNPIYAATNHRRYLGGLALPMRGRKVHRRRFAAFMSFANRYAAWVETLQRNLERCLDHLGHPGSVFLDRVDLGSGRSWVCQLQAGLEQSEHLILVTLETGAGK